MPLAFSQLSAGTHSCGVTTDGRALHVHRAGAGVVMSGKLYVVGGFDGFDPVAALDVYNPGTNS
jgi:Kelch motif